tara:strand:+ start:30667 stop:31878 length:1212 start_codon:yes stop_codon:yes gene_type:complete
LSEFFIARQPIFDRELRLHAYELLFRSSRHNANLGELDGDTATARVIATAAELGIEKLTRGRSAFINLPQRFIEEPDLMPLSPDSVVLEILETVALNEAAMAGIRSLRERGFRIALDDFVDSEAFDSILPMVDTVKLDVRELDPDQWHVQIARMRGHGCKLLAEKVETRQEFETLRELGVDYFQGFFFARPSVLRGRQIAPGRFNLLHTLARLNDPECSLEEIQELIGRDVALSVKALNYVNSAAGAMNRKIDSVREAIVYLGRDAVKRWVSVFLLASDESKPQELLTLALTRAKTCELLATRLGRDDEDVFFTTGLLSVMDSILDAPLAEILPRMALTTEMQGALLEHAGEKGVALALAKRLELGEEVEPAEALNLDLETLGDVYAEAVMWADKNLREMGMD